VRAIATSALTVLSVLDLVTDQPTGEIFAVEHSLVWMLCKPVKLKGFDWHAFDPPKPETFVDSLANMLVLHSKFHRHRNHGIYAISLPK